ncbi:MAG: hypothetical protein ABJB74_00775 [Gemmatimonas sp.]
MLRQLKTTVVRAFALAVCAHVICAGRIHAQSPVAGTWMMRYEHQPHSLHATTPAPIEVVQGRLTLRQSGDSVFGEWQTVVAKGDTAPPPRNVQGVQRRDSVFLRFLPVVDENAGIIASVLDDVVVFLKTYVHGMPPTTTALDVAMRGDALVGIRRTVLLDGTPRSDGEALTGARVKP